MNPVDKFGRSYQVGDLVLRSFRKGTISTCKVTKVDKGRVCLDNSPQPLWHPHCCVILPPNYDIP